MQLEDDSLWESFPQALEALETLEGTRRYMSCVTEAASFPSFPCELTRARCSGRGTPVEYPSPCWYAPFGTLSPSR